MYTLSNLIREALSDMSYLRYGSATSGSTTTLEDLLRPPTEDSQSYIGGTIFILRDAAGASASPEGEFARITGYTNKTFTFSPALSAEVSAGDRYAVSTNQFAYDELIELANDALRRFDIAAVDVSLLSAGNTTEYPIPAYVKQEDILKVEYSDGGSGWVTVLDYYTGYSPAGEAALLQMPMQLPSGRAIRLTYIGRHQRVNDWDDAVAEVIHPELARTSLVERMADRLTEKTKSSAPPFMRGYDKAKAAFEEAQSAHPIRRPARRARVLQLGSRRWC